MKTLLLKHFALGSLAASQDARIGTHDQMSVYVLLDMGSEVWCVVGTLKAGMSF